MGKDVGAASSLQMFTDNSIIVKNLIIHNIVIVGAILKL